MNYQILGLACLFFITSHLQIYASSATHPQETLKIPLIISEPIKERSLKWPVVCAIPIPEKKLTSHFSGQIINSRGEAIPSHIRAIGWWRHSNSIQWLQLRFTVASKENYTLILNPKNLSKPIKETLKIKQTNESIFVSTPLFSIIFSTNSKSEIRSLKLGEQQNILLKNISNHYFIDQKNQTHQSGKRGENRKISIESQSSTHAVIRCRGYYIGPDNEKFAQYTTRYHIFAGLSYFKVSHAFLILEDTESLQFKDIVYRLPFLPNSKSEVSFEYLSKGQKKIYHFPFFKPNKTLSMNQEVYRHYGQETSKMTIVEKNNSHENIIHLCKEAGGIVNTKSNQQNVTLGMKWLSQQFSKSFVVGKNGIQVHLWSNRGGLLDFRVQGVKRFWGKELNHIWENDRYGKWTMDYLNVYSKKRYDSAKGMEKSHEMWIWLKSDPVQDQTLHEFSSLIDDPVLAMSSPEWNCKSEVFGPMVPQNHKQYPKFEEILDLLLDRQLEAENSFANYGWWALGGVDHTFLEVHNGKLIAMPKRFTHATYLLHRSLWQLYYRSGDRRIYNYLIRRMYHILDIRVKHIKDKRWPTGSWGGAPYVPIFWGSLDPYLSNSYDHSFKEALWTYYATGDQRWAEWIKKWSHQVKNLSMTDIAKKVTSSTSRPTFTFLDNLTSIYSYRGDKNILKKANELASLLIDLKQKHGIRPMSGGGVISAKGFYYISSLLAYAKQSGNPAALEAAKRVCSYAYYQSVISRHDNIYLTEMCYGYYLLKDPKFLSEAQLQVNDVRDTRLENLKRSLLTYKSTVKTFRHSVQDKHLWDSLPRLAWGLNHLNQQNKSLPPARLLPPNTTTIALKKNTHKSLHAEILSQEPSLSIYNSKGKPIAKKYNKVDTYIGSQGLGWDTPFYIHQFLLPSKLHAGPYIILGSFPLKLIKTNAEKYASHIPKGLSLPKYELDSPILLPVGPSGKLTVQARYPKSLTFSYQNRKVITNIDINNQKIYLRGLKPSSLINVHVLHKNNYLAFLDQSVQNNWIGLGKPSSYFTPKIKLLIDTPEPLPNQEKEYVRGINHSRKNDFALQLPPGKKLMLPTSLNLKEKKLDLLSLDRGSIEFWYKPLWDSRWLKQNDFPISIIKSGDRFHLFYHKWKDQFELLEVSIMGNKSHGSSRLKTKLELGKWHHIAITWYPWKEAKNNILVMIYVNGKTRPIVQTNEPGSQPHYHHYKAGSFIEISGGSSAGAIIDNLRISKIPYYNELKKINYLNYRTSSFNPIKEALTLDQNTSLWMSFDQQNCIFKSFSGKFTGDAKIQ